MASEVRNHCPCNIVDAEAQFSPLSQVPPLRIQKGSGNSHGNNTSPSKLPRVTNRPLSELSPMAIRRNSPSFPQGKVCAEPHQHQETSLTLSQSKLFAADTSPANSSPFSTTSPRLFWQGRDPSSPAREATESPPVPSPRKRSSIENLKKASRVKNSSMYEIEQKHYYDPSRPSILDGRPHSTHIPRQSSPVRISDVGRKENVAPSDITASAKSPVKELEEEDSSIFNSITPLSPSRSNGSPSKSSLSKKTGSSFTRSGFNPETGVWEDDDDIQEKKLPAGRGLHRHQKSVTFDQAPPQINEYEMTTPAPSSIASGSREGSYESGGEDDEEEEEASFERGSSMDHDDSFDASLEDTDKTPVVLPDDWRFMSPDTANTDLTQHEEDVFEDEYGSPAPTAQPGLVSNRPHQMSASSVDSNGQSRPLPPLPPFLGAQAKQRSDSLTGAFERISIASRSLPNPPMPASATKADILSIRASNSLSAEDRVRLLALQDQERERRLRRLGSKDPSPVHASPAPATTKEESPVSDVEPMPVPMMFESRNSTPSLSRDSILAGLRGQVGHDSRDSSEDIPDMYQQRDFASLDPDIPIPSMEDPTQPRIKQEDSDETNLYSIPDESGRRVSDSKVSVNNEDDLTSQYSQPSLASFAPITDDEQETPKAQSPVQGFASKPASERVSLPDFIDFGQTSSFDIGLAPYMSTKEEKPKPTLHSTPATNLPDLAALRESIQRSYTPDTQFQNAPAFNFDKALPGTPESVVRYSAGPEQLTDRAFVESNRHVEEPEFKSERSFSPSEPSETGSVLANDREGSPVSAMSAEPGGKPELTVTHSDIDESGKAKATDIPIEEAQKKRVSSLVPLDIPRGSMDEGLGLGLEREFDRVVETQKVEFELSLQRLYYPFNGRFPSSELPRLEGHKDSNPLECVPILPRPRGARPPPGALLPASPITPGIEDSFANRPGRRQRGYLMRQNTKIVVASERVSHDECRSPTLPTVTEDGMLGIPTEANHVVPSPRKTSQPTWTAEPWNGKSRRKSIRVGGEKVLSKRKPVEGSVPPLPGQSSNVQEGLEAVAEDEMGEEEEWEEGAERGRLFVKVVGVKDLQMPFPQRK